MSPEKSESRRFLERSILDLVRETLERNPRIVVVEQLEIFSNLAPSAHHLDIFVAPKNPIFNPEVLQKDLEGLIPIGPTSQEKFTPIKSIKSFHFGWLTFAEIIGRKKEIITTTIEAIDEETLEKCGISGGVSTEIRTVDILRTIKVRLFPAVEIAKSVAESLSKESERKHDERVHLEFGIKEEQVRKFFPHLLKQFRKDTKAWSKRTFSPLGFLRPVGGLIDSVLGQEKQ